MTFRSFFAGKFLQERTIMKRKKERKNIWIKKGLAFLLTVILAAEQEFARVMASSDQENSSYETEENFLSEQWEEGTTEYPDTQEVTDTQVPVDTPEATEKPESEDLQEEMSEELQEKDVSDDVEISDDSEQEPIVEIEEEQDTQTEEPK